MPLTTSKQKYIQYEEKNRTQGNGEAYKLNLANMLI